MFPAETTASALAVGHRAHGRDERRVRLRAHGLGGLLGHLDRVRRVDELEPARVEPGRPVEDHVDAVGGRLERAGDDLVRGAVPAQRVDRDAGHGVYAGEAERLDLAALVGAAGRADAVGELRRVALRAGVHARRLDRVRRPALVAPGLGCFPLRDCHGRQTL